jgi:hypothetical protein
MLGLAADFMLDIKPAPSDLQSLFFKASVLSYYFKKFFLRRCCDHST